MPLPASMNVRDARDVYLDDNGFSAAAYDADTFQIDVLGRTWTLKNGAQRRRAIPRHDLQHVVTGYGTDLIGEAEQSAWEIVAGIDSLFLIVFKLGAITLGLFLSPRRVVRSLRRARGTRSLYGDPIAYEAVLAMTLGELRAYLGVPAGGFAEHPAGRHRRAPKKSP